MQIDILKLAEIIGAVALILTTVIGAYKLYDKLLDRVDKLEQRVGKLETELNRVKKSTSISTKPLTIRLKFKTTRCFSYGSLFRSQ